MGWKAARLREIIEIGSPIPLKADPEEEIIFLGEIEIVPDIILIELSDEFPQPPRDCDQCGRPMSRHRKSSEKICQPCQRAYLPDLPPRRLRSLLPVVSKEEPHDMTTTYQKMVGKKLEDLGYLFQGQDGRNHAVYTHPLATRFVTVSHTPGDNRDEENTLAAAKRYLEHGRQYGFALLDHLMVKFEVPINGESTIETVLIQEVQQLLEKQVEKPWMIQPGSVRERALKEVLPIKDEGGKPYKRLTMIKRGGPNGPHRYLLRGPLFGTELKPDEENGERQKKAAQVPVFPVSSRATRRQRTLPPRRMRTPPVEQVVPQPVPQPAPVAELLPQPEPPTPEVVPEPEFPRIVSELPPWLLKELSVALFPLQRKQLTQSRERLTEALEGLREAEQQLGLMQTALTETLERSKHYMADLKVLIELLEETDDGSNTGRDQDQTDRGAAEGDRE